MNIWKSLIVIAVLALCQTVAANTIHVCPTCSHTIIQAAVNDALSGDTVMIAAGSFAENVTIEGKKLTLQGAVGGTSGLTEVHAVGAHPVFTLGSGVAGATPELIEIHNLVISGGNHTGGTGVGGGVQVRAGAYLHLYDSAVTQNVAPRGAGIGVDSPGAPQTLISGCQIDHNNANGKYQGGGGISIGTGSAVSIQGSTVTQNVSFDGGGALSDTGSQLTITDSIFSGNTSLVFGTKVGPTGGGGGGLYTNGSLSISGGTFVNNIADGEGQGGGGLTIFLAPGDTHVIANTIIAHNGLTTDELEGLGGGIAAFGGAPQSNSVLTLNSVYVVENTAAPNGGGGIFTDGVTLALANTTVKDNVGGQICDNNTGCQ
jgi:hypothetical protein